MNYPEYVEVNNRRYKINSDFRVALECNKIAQDVNIGDTERALAIIYKLFGDEALDCEEDYEMLLKLAIKYLKCGEEDISNEKEEPDMDFFQDEKYIKSSFKYDYQYNPYDLDYLHWYEFWNDLCNLSDNEFGNCCILNRIRQLRRIKPGKIKDLEERKKVIEAQKRVALKKPKKVQSDKAKESARNFYKELFK